jgi:hypothetical protein
MRRTRRRARIPAAEAAFLAGMMEHPADVVEQFAQVNTAIDELGARSLGLTPGCFPSGTAQAASGGAIPALAAVRVPAPFALQGCGRGASMRPFHKPPLPCRYCHAESMVIAAKKTAASGNVRAQYGRWRCRRTIGQ